MTQQPFNHLHDKVRHLLQCTAQDRISFIKKDSWVGYDSATIALDKMTELLEYPRNVRMPSMLLVGDPGNGKSTILERFVKRHPIDIQQNGRALVPVLMFNMSTSPDESRFWSDILTMFQIAHRDTERVQSLKKEAMGMLIDSHTRLLIIDEFHNVLFGSPRKQRQMLAVIKNLSNDLRLPIVCAGTRESILVMHTDPQLSSRFEAFALPKWELSESFLSMLAGFECLLPLKNASEIYSEELSCELLMMSNGNLGALVNILKKAATLAIENGSEKITLDTLNKINWISVEDYARQAREEAQDSVP